MDSNPPWSFLSNNETLKYTRVTIIEFLRVLSFLLSLPWHFRWAFQNANREPASYSKKRKKFYDVFVFVENIFKCFFRLFHRNKGERRIIQKTIFTADRINNNFTPSFNRFLALAHILYDIVLFSLSYD